MEILYQDQYLVVCVKLSGVLSQSDDKGRENMPQLLETQLGCSVFPVHRLDLEVSGVMVYAKTAEAAAKLSAMASSHEGFRKEYLAVIQGNPDEKEGILEDLLFHDKQKNKTYVVKKLRSGVKKAKLSYCVLSEKDGESLVAIRLYTGRTHQIRVQFASRKMPLIGDRRYGGRTGDGIALCSCRLSFVHPITKEKIRCGYFPQSLGGFEGLAEIYRGENGKI